MLGDHLISILAPFSCLGCGREGLIVCDSCLVVAKVDKRSTCYLCNKLTVNWRVCRNCQPKTAIKGVIVASHYEGLIKELIKRLKFERAAAAAQPLASLLASQVNAKEFDLLTWVPGSTRRQRQRGYNQARLIAEELGKQLGLSYGPLLQKLGQSHQVGTNRRQRLRQLQGQMYAVRKNRLAAARVLIVDDVVTTGATMTEAARALKAAGAQSSWGIAVAKH